MFMSLQEWYRTIWIPARRLRHGECFACGYALHGVEADKCPECGVRKP
jgi:rubrerythrin